MANQQQPPSSSSPAAATSYGDASDLLAEALKQMDGLLGGKRLVPSHFLLSF